ncbi:unnamed protein product [Rotaria sp. Silwood2]|nr:unnamed protein product [Rotaria sp. Silwood2]CAF2874083.1 unnamed protein product [Rotaria sp. Silwood2]CAF4158625.1 unnamed protein product [Rotaria sp. Silwood2]CAF4349135.1 unnamed protein product [Rotaria sp. Silwood2]
MLPASSISTPSNATDDCSICLSALAAGSPLLTLTCNHKFHLQCLVSNIQARNKECPLCRAAIDASIVELLAGSRQPPIQYHAPPPISWFHNHTAAVNVFASVEDPIDETAVRALSDSLASARQTATTAANAASNLSLITVSTTLEYGAQISQEESNIYGLVTLQVPSAIVPSESKSIALSRVPIDLVCVVDQSGSMSGMKMRLLKQTLVYIVEQLNDLDRLAIISFNTQAYNRSHGLKRMNQQNQQILMRTINNDLSGGGGTYIGCGLQMGINLFISRQTRNPLGALLLLTDGQDDKKHDYSQMMGTLPEGVLCHTFGYGPDHTAALLVQLAEQGNGGTFTYIDQQQAVGPAFAMALGGLFSCVAQQLRVNIEFNEEYRITHVHSKYQHEPKNLPSKKVTFKLNDLNSDEKRNLVFQLHVPKVNNNQNIEMASRQIMSHDEQALNDQHTIGKDEFLSLNN